MSDVLQFVAPIQGFAGRPAPFQLEAFMWYLHEVKKKERISTAELAACFDDAHIPRPANTASSLAKLCERKPPRVLRDKQGYRLAALVRNEMAELLPVRATAIKTTALLTALLDRVTDPIQKAFLQEALVCFKHHAYRAAVVMAWNLAFSVVLDRIFSHHLSAFNSQIGSHGFKTPIRSREDFSELKEFQIIALARAAKILSKETSKTLDEKLGKRNTAAHPSSVVVSVSTAEEVIFDLIENILLKSSL